MKIKNNMTKVDEIAVINYLEKKYLKCPDNYLYDYFTGQNAEWLRQKIKDDFIPPLPYKMETEIESLQLKIRELKNQVEEVEDKLLCKKIC